MFVVQVQVPSTQCGAPSEQEVDVHSWWKKIYFPPVNGQWQWLSIQYWWLNRRQWSVQIASVVQAEIISIFLLRGEHCRMGNGRNRPHNVDLRTERSGPCSQRRLCRLKYVPSTQCGAPSVHVVPEHSWWKKVQRSAATGGKIKRHFLRSSAFFINLIIETLFKSFVILKFLILFLVRITSQVLFEMIRFLAW